MRGGRPGDHKDFGVEGAVARFPGHFIAMQENAMAARHRIKNRLKGCLTRLRFLSPGFFGCWNSGQKIQVYPDFGFQNLVSHMEIQVAVSLNFPSFGLYTMAVATVEAG